MDNALFIYEADSIGAWSGKSEVLMPLPGDAFKYAEDPDYKELLDPRQMRRMNRVVRMSCYLTKKLLTPSGRVSVAAIITASGLGCTTETLKFLDATYVLHTKQIPAPSAFINSTHNTPGGFLASMLQCYGYNTTFSQRDISFESALIDALTIDPDNGSMILLGTFEELNPVLTGLLDSGAYLKGSHAKNRLKLNVPLSEGSAFFLVSRNAPKSRCPAIRNIQISKASGPPIKFLENAINEIGRSGLKNGMIFSASNGSPADLDKYGYLGTRFAGLEVIDYKRWIGEFATANALGAVLACRLINGSSVLYGHENLQPDFIMFVQHTLDGIFSTFTVS